MNQKNYCEVHGFFGLTEKLRIRKKCKNCCDIDILLKRKEEFFNRCHKKWGEAYDYSLVEYQNIRTKVKIICKIHGVFEQTPNGHYRSGCCKCGHERTNKSKIKTTEEFIARARIAHQNYYNYEKTDYRKAREKLIITCPRHGDFEQIAENHLRNHGCFSCRATSSKNEKIISNYLNENNIEFQNQKSYEDLRTTNCTKLFYDFYLPEYDLLIEYDGEHHFRPIRFNKNIDAEKEFQNRKKLDLMKTKYAETNKINLIRISYKENTKLRIQQILKGLIDK